MCVRKRVRRVGSLDWGLGRTDSWTARERYGRAGSESVTGLKSGVVCD